MLQDTLVRAPPPLQTVSASHAQLQVVKPLNGDSWADAFLAKVGDAPEPKMLRVLKKEVQADTAWVDQLISVARALKGLSHPGVLKILGAGRMSDGRAYVLSDFEEGESLQSRGMLAVESLVELAVPVCDAIDAVHQSGQALGSVTARDVLLTGSGPKLDVAAGLLRKVERSPDGDVRAFTRVLQSLAAPGQEKPHLDAALTKVTADPTLATLRSSLEGLRQSWSGSTSVNGAKAEATVEEVDPDLSGTTLGQYELKSIIGEGAMGQVYLGRHARIGRQAAIKVLKAEHARQKDLVQRFIQEATAVNAIKNQHIVEVYDFGEQPGSDGSPRVFCVMELLDGIALVDEMEKGPLALKRIVKVAQQVTRALGAAHALGIVHRDIKPENIFLHKKDGNADFVKVLDFGVAKLLKPIGELPVSSTQAGIVIGTPEYMAPEQALGLPTDLRVDLYAVGLVLYELLSGRQPFHADTFGKLVLEITSKNAPPLPPQTKGGEAIPRSLVQLVVKCLEKNPDHRFQSAAELVAALEPFVSGDLASFDPQAALDDAKAARALAPRAWPKYAAAAAVVALAAAGAWFVFGGAPAAVTVAPPPVPEARATPADPPPSAEKGPVKDTTPAAPAQVTLDLASTPVGAKVTRLDSGELLGTTPFKVALAPSEEKLKLRFELDGREPTEREVLLTRDLSLSIDLPARAVAEPPRKQPKAGKKGVTRDGVVDPFSN